MAEVSDDLLERILDELHGGTYDELRELLHGPKPDLLPTKSVDLLDQAVLVVVEGEPRGKGRPRFAKRGNFVSVYTDAETEAYEALIQAQVLQSTGRQALLDEAMRIRRRTFIEAFVDVGGRPHFTGPVRIEMEIAHKIRDSWTNKKKAGARDGFIAPTIKVDFDNCAKVFCDAFNKCMWVDDTQVIKAEVIKTWADEPYVMVRVIPLDLLSA